MTDHDIAAKDPQRSDTNGRKFLMAGFLTDAVPAFARFARAPRADTATAANSGDARPEAAARGPGHNNFKIELGKRTLRRTLLQDVTLEI
jgi:hypothetical protein